MIRCRNISILTALFLIIFAHASYAKERVAVMDFENKTQHNGWHIGRGAADMLATALVKNDHFTVLEREKVEALLKEQDFGAGGRVDPTTAAKIGKVIGVEYIVTGAVTEFGYSESDLAKENEFALGKKGYHASVDVRMINVNTSEIVFADSGTHSKASLSFKFMGFGGGEKANEKHATEAMRAAIDDVAKKMKITATPATATGQGAGSMAMILVADVDGPTVAFNNGSNAGLETDQEVTVSRKGKVIKDPSTGKILKVKYKKIGTVKLTMVEASYAEGKAVNGNGFQVGDVIQ